MQQAACSSSLMIATSVPSWSPLPITTPMMSSSESLAPLLSRILRETLSPVSLKYRSATFFASQETLARGLGTPTRNTSLLTDTWTRNWVGLALELLSLVRTW